MTAKDVFVSTDYDEELLPLALVQGARNPEERGGGLLGHSDEPLSPWYFRYRQKRCNGNQLQPKRCGYPWNSVKGLTASEICQKSIQMECAPDETPCAEGFRAGPLMSTVVTDPREIPGSWTNVAALHRGQSSPPARRDCQPVLAILESCQILVGGGSWKLGKTTLIGGMRMFRLTTWHEPPGWTPSLSKDPEALPSAHAFELV
ncbi:uncharacterized protein CIMG_08614 [Coccidioides immitis RS]|uniref:Uncharacterized protein n=3 Tax=Coccidioides immitis TaxID=5501 RepID=J3K5V4_COCIM|nr:uncharacterized protein CIMG_08614 [Coccidioides immitis RS]EAS29868.3 hypothetical protein CIMG_08614 [Coccidioides immitis RS]KMP06849.1 hypothetical protein CIRG_06530 [Coccidioides immitis RMSCC 2394]KMU91348.1 hypothetical protein CIHG_09093 [Coccidioides immitis H538.4]